MKKTFLFLAAALMSAMTWAGETKTLIIDGSQLTSTATSAVTDFTYGDFTIAMSDGAKFQASSGDNRFEGTDKAILIGKSGKYIYNKTPFGKITKFEIYANKGASAKVSVGVLFSTTAISEYATGDNTYTATLSTLDNVYDCSANIPEGAQYFWYQVTNANNSQVMFRITYEEGTTPQRTLQSIYIDGTATKLEYIEGESFDPAGLKVMGKYDSGEDTEITAGIDWTVTPETLALGTTSVTVTATAGGKTSEPKEIAITVKEKPAAKYVPVAWNEIEDGGKYFITAAKDGEFYFAAKAFATGKATAIAFDASLSLEADMWTFTKSDNVWKISAADGEGLYMTNTNNGLACAADKGADFTVTQGSSAEFTYLTASDGTNDRYVSLYNQQDFRCYKTSSPSGIYDLKLYGLKKEGVVTKPSFTPAESEFDGSVEVTLTAEEGAAIYYTLDGSDPSVDGEWPFKIPYEASFTLTTTTTVKAIAVKDGKSSDVAEKTYTLIPAYTVEEIAAITPTGQTFVLVLNDEEIVDLYTGTSGDISGLYFQATDKKIELYNQSYAFPKEWEKGGKVSGRVMGEWTDFKGQWELKIATEEIEKLDYTAPQPTGINNAKANTKATKAIVNGQIVIVRDNKTYNVLGF